MIKRFFKQLRLKLFIVGTVFLLIGLPRGCKDPYDYKPPEDILVPPPDPPQLIFPADSVWYVLDYGDVVFITFQWDTIYDADMYEFEFDTSQSFEKTAWSELTPEDTITFVFWPDTTDTVAYYWHVRAASDFWVWWTSWSEVRTFIIPQAFFENRH
ncbi:hypothetical protein AMJ52_02540 [candidate division TA06 bacterium DG_78]|uniref:SbsA Ig-like domain-containing protein n=1 Tax=candidate division TA06 bacterium DG_78 TaxID=1703772 RepID=A0A0S7YGP0_UNCT6|nr:MAG: hypothetical protein AMJ52_02540 [candidate division TA06 bacterium DG_78]